MNYEIFDADTGEVLDTMNGFSLAMVEDCVQEYLENGVSADWRIV